MISLILYYLIFRTIIFFVVKIKYYSDIYYLRQIELDDDQKKFVNHEYWYYRKQEIINANYNRRIELLCEDLSEILPSNFCNDPITYHNLSKIINKINNSDFDSRFINSLNKLLNVIDNHEIHNYYLNVFALH